YFLIDTSRQLLVSLQVDRWPYILAGLFLTLTFWSRAMIHTLTVIKWPLEFGHNFLYIICTVVQSIMYTQMTELSAWYALGMLYAAAAWGLAAFDQRLVRQRLAECRTSAAAELYGIVAKEQRTNVVRSIPAFFCFYAA